MEKEPTSTSINQNFHAPVRNVAGRDIIQNITSIHVLRALERAVTQSATIPEPQKAGLLQRIRSLVEEPYISGLATSAIYEALKSVLASQ
jgi:hypothetical protein